MQHVVEQVDDVKLQVEGDARSDHPVNQIGADTVNVATY